MKMSTKALLIGLVAFGIAGGASAEGKLKALLVDGQNNHDWKSCQPILKWILEDSGRFTVDVSTTPPAKSPADAWKSWHPKFKDYDVVLSNYNGEDWPAEVRAEFVQYVHDGGGLSVVHAADNSWGNWAEFNDMIGVGGWGGRNEKSGPMLYWADGKIVRDETPGAGGTHGAQHEFVVETRADHPILQGLPAKWKHAKDELYSKLRGPAKNLTVLATAFADPAQRGTGKNEPILMVLDYGKGRVFHSVMGHGPEAMSGLGFQVTLARGCEWAATGKVTLPAPKEGTLSAETAAKRAPPAK